MDFSEINNWAVLLAAVAKFMLGGLWFSPLLFADSWVREVGLKKEDMTSPTGPMLISALLGLVTAFTLAVIITLADLDLRQALALGVVLGIGIVAAMTAPHFAFEGRSFRLYMIYAGQYVAELLVMTAIIGGWR